MPVPDPERAAHHLAEFLDALGYDRHADPELADTPRRVAELLAAFRPARALPRLSTCPAPSRLGPVVLRDLPFHSLCAHHLLPFFGTADLAYLPGDRLAGVGSLPRLLAALAHRPQLQERLGEQLAERLVAALAPRGVVVRLRARHLCMEMRGAASTGTLETRHRRGPRAEDLEQLLAGR